MRVELQLDFHLWIASSCTRPNIFLKGVHSTAIKRLERLVSRFLKVVFLSILIFVSTPG